MDYLQLIHRETVQGRADIAKLKRDMSESLGVMVDEMNKMKHSIQKMRDDLADLKKRNESTSQHLDSQVQAMNNSMAKIIEIKDNDEDSEDFTVEEKDRKEEINDGRVPEIKTSEKGTWLFMCPHVSTFA